MDQFCKICHSVISKIFETTVLKKYSVAYFKCTKCGFIQTESPYWLSEAYNNAIANLDIGLVYRNLIFADTIEKMLLNEVFDPNGDFLDYGGGYGMFVRIMRDKGFSFYRQDIYCDNLFAKHFDISDLPSGKRFTALTAFEVFEHLVDPVRELEQMLDLSDNIIFSTELQPAEICTPETWWYFVPETGQHISLYSLNSLKGFAEKFHLHFYTNGSSLHVFTKSKLHKDPFIILKNKSRFSKMISLLKHKPVKRESLLHKDFEYIKNKER